MFGAGVRAVGLALDVKAVTGKLADDLGCRDVVSEFDELTERRIVGFEPAGPVVILNPIISPGGASLTEVTSKRGV